MPSLLYVYQDSMHKKNVSVSKDDFKDLKKYIAYLLIYPFIYPNHPNILTIYIIIKIKILI